MRALLAFDKFKDAMSAHDACFNAAAALRAEHPSWEFDICPLTDGGEGFARILTESAKGELHIAQVNGPKGEPVFATFGLVPVKNIPAAARQRLALPINTSDNATIAVIEMAAASGLALLLPHERDPWKTSSYGTGELMRTAASLNAGAILLGVGGSATNDLGLGALSALGLEFTGGGEIFSPPTPERWSALDRIRGMVASDFPPIRVACDVT